MRNIVGDWLVDGPDLDDLIAANGGGYLSAISEALTVGRTTRDGIPIEQILHDRPDVFRAFYEEYYGPTNDHHSDAWVARVGGTTVEDYANYWYEQHGRWEGYAPHAANAAPDPDAGPRTLPGIEETGRTTSDGIPLSEILTDRPDVFRAFFTEFHGRNNDQKSSAWVDRVGGETVEDYANYWYEHYGRWGQYARRPEPAGATDEEPEAPALPPADDEAPPAEIPSAPDDVMDPSVVGELTVGQSMTDPAEGLF